jgi:hypothetical protein
MIKGEVEELVERSIVHPSVEKAKGHRAYLVCNGEITDEVRYLIDQMNSDNVVRDRCVAHLDVTTMHGLLHDFVAAQGQFLPTTVSELGCSWTCTTLMARTSCPFTESSGSSSTDSSRARPAPNRRRATPSRPASSVPGTCFSRFSDQTTRTLFSQAGQRWLAA